MIPRIQQQILGKLSGLCDLPSDVRMGQLLAHLGFLAQDMFNRSLWDVDDEQLLQVIEQHWAELSARQAVGEYAHPT